MPQEAALRDIPAQCETTATQPGNPAGRAQRRLTWTDTFMHKAVGL